MEKVQGDPRDMGKGSRSRWWETVWMEETLKHLSPTLGGLEDAP